MASSPSSSDNKTFTITPSPKTFYSTTYKIRVTTAAEDSAGNNIAQYTQTYGFETSVTFPLTAGSAHTCYMLDNGSVKCWGSNTYGQLGLGNTTDSPNPSVVDLGSGIKAKAIAAGGNHTCAIIDNSSIKCWGKNSSGQLGLGSTDNLGDGGSEMGDDLDTVDLGSGGTAKVIVAGGSHTCTILDNETIKCWGQNDRGQLGLGNDTDSPNASLVDMGSGITAKAIAAGESHTCAILNNSAIKCWGRASEGQIGLIKGDNDIGDGPGEMGVEELKLAKMGTGRTATAIAAGKYHNCAILDNSSIKCWGANASGQLGLGHTNNRGADEGGTDQMGDELLSVDLGTGRTARGIIAGDNQTCAILDNSSIKCWGSNISGELGIGEPGNRGDNSSNMGDALPVISL